MHKKRTDQLPLMPCMHGHQRNELDALHSILNEHPEITDRVYRDLLGERVQADRGAPGPNQYGDAPVGRVSYPSETPRPAGSTSMKKPVKR